MSFVSTKRKKERNCELAEVRRAWRIHYYFKNGFACIKMFCCRCDCRKCLRTLSRSQTNERENDTRVSWTEWKKREIKRIEIVFAAQIFHRGQIYSLQHWWWRCWCWKPDFLNAKVPRKILNVKQNFMLWIFHLSSCVVSLLGLPRCCFIRRRRHTYTQMYIHIENIKCGRVQREMTWC